MNALHYTLIGAGAVVAAAAIGVGVAAPYIHKLFKHSFGRSDPKPDGQNAFLDGLRAKGFDEQVEIVKHGWNRLASTAHEKVYITSHDGHRLCAKLYAPEHPKATVILVHGYHSKGDMDFGTVFDFYDRRGIGMLIVYQRAHGESAGNYLTFGAKEKYDIHIALAVITMHQNNGRFGIFGRKQLGAKAVSVMRGDVHLFMRGACKAVPAVLHNLNLLVKALGTQSVQKCILSVRCRI